MLYVPRTTQVSCKGTHSSAYPRVSRQPDEALPLACLLARGLGSLLARRPIPRGTGIRTSGPVCTLAGVALGVRLSQLGHARRGS